MAKKPDILEVRRVNLRALIAQWGGPSTLAKKLHLSGPSYLSQLVGENRPITEKTARKLEAALDLPDGWLDEMHGSAAKPVPVDDRLVTKVIRLVGETLDQESITLTHAKFSDLVVMVYEEAQRTGAISETYVKQLVKLLR